MEEPPQILVVGDGVYARALASIRAAGQLTTEQTIGHPAVNAAGNLPLVLADLERAFLISGVGHSAADLLRTHDGLWRWVKTLSPKGDQHELAILFVLPPRTEGMGKALLAGLGLDRNAAAAQGHGLACMDEPLEALLAKGVAIDPMDLTSIEARKAADLRQAVLRKLGQFNTHEDLAEAVREVVEIFCGDEHLLDLFCRPPSHQNGNQLRSWLNSIVTQGVTQNNLEEVRQKIAVWLVPESLS